MTRTKVKKFTKIRWDISWRMRFIGKTEDEQIRELILNNPVQYLLDIQNQTSINLEIWNEIMIAPKNEKKTRT